MQLTRTQATEATLCPGAGWGTLESPGAQVEEAHCLERNCVSKVSTSKYLRARAQHQKHSSFADVETSLPCGASHASADPVGGSFSGRPELTSACRLGARSSDGSSECCSEVASPRKRDTSKCKYVPCLACDHNLSSCVAHQSNSVACVRNRVSSEKLSESKNGRVRLKRNDTNLPNLSFNKERETLSRFPDAKRRRPQPCMENSPPFEGDRAAKPARAGVASTHNFSSLGRQNRSHDTSVWRVCTAFSAFILLLTTVLPGYVVVAGPVSLPGGASPATARESLWLGHTRRLDIRRTQCRSSAGEIGVCMFNFECLQRAGGLIGTCMDGFLFGVCCKLSDLNLPGAADSVQSSAAVTVASVGNEVQEGATEKQRTSSPTTADALNPSGEAVLLTKTKPNNSVLVYAAESLTKRPFITANFQSTKTSNASDIHSNAPKISENNSTVTTTLDVHDKVFPHLNKSEPQPLQISTEISGQSVLFHQVSNEIDQKVQSIAADDFENEFFHTTSRSSDDATTTGAHFEGSTPESSLGWTLLPQPSPSSREPAKSSTKVRFAAMSPSSISVSAFMTFPKFPVDSTTPLSPASINSKPSSENYLGASYEDNFVDVTQASSYLVKVKPSETLASTTAKAPTSTSWLGSNRLNTSDPMAFWTTTRPSRRPALQPRPVPSSTEGETTEELVFWTTLKPSLRPRPTARPSSAVEKEPVIKTQLSSMLLPVKHVDTSLKAEGLIEELIASMSHTLMNDVSKISSTTPTVTTPSSKEPWASSTYAILPAEIDVAENTIDVDSSVLKTSSPPPDQDSSTFPSTLKAEPTTPSSMATTDMTGTLEKPSLTNDTNSDVSGTTPIDEFIENLLNSLIMSNSSTAPPIDLDLVQQMLNGSDIGSFDDLGPAIASIASFANVSVNFIEDSAHHQPQLSSSTTTQATTSSTAPFSAPLRSTATTTTTRPSTTTSATTTTTTAAPTRASIRSTTTTTPTTTTPTTSTYKNWNWRTTCGVRPLSRTGRIVNGEETAFGVWPWQVLVKESTWLGLFTKVKCGGVLLSERYVLTAAHCQPGFLGSLIVVLGDHDLSGDFEPAPATERNVKRVVVHRGYIARTFDNDLALLELDRPVKFAEHILPICLPENDDDYVGQVGTVTGWGRLSYGGNIPKKLNEVRLPIVPNSECQSWFREAGHGKKIKPEFMCAGFKSGEKDSCEGDSGGPLTVRGPDGRWVLAGTVSHGIKCAYPNLPGVYMRMSYYKPWILKVMQS